MKRLETAIKGSVLEAYTQTKFTDICVACELDDMFCGFNTARKAAWLKSTQLKCASDRKDLTKKKESKMLPLSWLYYFHRYF